jgi:Tfp pilus assembly protein PilN
MSQVNLLPPEIRERQRIRRQTFMVAFAGAAVMALLVLLYFIQVIRLSDVNEDLQTQRAENAQLEQEIADLQRFQELRAMLEDRQNLIDGILANEVSWSGVLRDISLVIPQSMWLNDLSGNVTVSTATVVEGGELPETGLIGNMQFNGTALDTSTVALWLTRLEEVRGWVNAWLSNASRTILEGVEVVDFTSSVDLTPEATVPVGGGQT